MFVLSTSWFALWMSGKLKSAAETSSQTKQNTNDGVAFTDLLPGFVYFLSNKAAVRQRPHFVVWLTLILSHLFPFPKLYYPAAVSFTQAAIPVNDQCGNALSINVNSDDIETFINGATLKNKCGGSEETRGIFYTFGTIDWRLP